jgi:glyoxylase-like metal-dependent hydrolase (beta-lactamase superfamily II)
LRLHACKQLDPRLAQAGLVAGDIDAVFVTHEHGDHIGCARMRCRGASAFRSG